MFNLLKKTENMATLLVIAMTEYLKEAEQQSCKTTLTIKDIREQYNRLVRLGMGNTQNCKKIENIINKADTYGNDLIKAKSLIAFVKAVHAELNPDAILVSNSEFEKLCKKYKLQVGLLSDYCGVIPEKSIQDMEKVGANISNFSMSHYLNNIGKNARILLFVKSANLSEFDYDVITHHLKSHNYIVKVTESNPHYDGYWWGKDLVGLKGDIEHPVLDKLDGTIISNDTMFIACPPQQLKNPQIKISKRAVDPAIFQYTPYGVLVHTIWGEEAEDKVLKQYLELNTRISQM